MSASKFRLPVVLAVCAAFLAACSDGGGSNGGGGGASVAGVAVKGPLVNATVKAYAVDYGASDLIGAAAPVDTGTTNSQARITDLALDPEGAPYVVVVEADADTIDLTTGAVPVITRMKTIITAEMLNSGTPVVATPLTSMAVEVAASKTPSAATLQASLDAAQNTVKSTLGFGLDESVDLFTASPVLTNDADTPQEQAQVAAYRLAVEAVSAVLSNAAADSTELNDSATDVLSSLALDLSDGKIDGMNGATSLPQLAGVDVMSVTVANLTIPGTTIPVSSIIGVLDNEASSLGSSVTVDPSVTVTPEEVATVADSDFDGVADDIDNCVNVKNASQLDANDNGVGAACEAAPQISAVSASGVEDGGAININLAGSDAQDDTLTFTVDGVALPAGQATYAYTPAADFSGQVILSYSVSDGESSSGDSTITIDVTAADDAPTGTLAIVGAAEEGVELTLDNQLSDADGPLTVVSYQWYADGIAITGATEAAFTLSQAQVGKAVRADIVVSDGVFANATVSSDTTAAVANTINNPSSGDVVILGTPTEGQTLTFSNTLSDPDGPVAETGYQWLADGAPIAGATSTSLLLTQEQVGKAISLMLAYTDGTFGDNFTSAATGPVANINNAAAGSVTITGAATEDETLQADTSAIADEDGLTGVTYSYQWLADAVAISGATNSQLTLADSHVGKAITVQVDFTDDLGGNESLISLPTAIVANVNDPVQGSVVISGNAIETEQLSVAGFLAGLTDDDGLPATPPAETTYQWKRAGVDIAGANAATYTLVAADVGSVITVEIQFPDNRGTTETVLSSATAPVAQFDDQQPTGSVVISGDTQNQTWTASNDLADADGPATLLISYQWYADGAPIDGATTDSFTPGQAYVGASIFVRASYTDDGSNYTERDSAPVLVIDADDAYTGGVSISGTAAEDQTLTATNDLADVDGAIVIESYQWKADGVNIAGATSDTLLLSQQQVGAVITVDVTFSDGVFASQVATSAGTAAVANANDAPQGSVTISGTAAPGNNLTASDTLSDEDGMGTVSYEWFVNGVTTSVLNATYVVQPEDVGLSVFVRASYLDGQSTSESVDSAPLTVQGTAPTYSFNPANFSGQSVYDVYVDDDQDSECIGTNTFDRYDLGVGGDFSAAVACDDSVITGTWALEQNDEVLVLSSPMFDDVSYVVANGDVLDNKQQYCWLEDASITDSATALDICRQDVSPEIFLGSFYFNQADVHADTFDVKRLSHTWLAGRTLYDVWFGGVDTTGDCQSDADAAGLTKLMFSADGFSIDISGVAGDQCIEPGVPVEINEAGLLGGSVAGTGINYLGSTDQYLELVFRNDDGSPDNVDRFYHNLTEAQAAYDAIAVHNGGSFTYTQNFLDSQLAKSPIYNIHQSGGQWYVEKIEFDGAGYVELTERTAQDLRFSDPAAFYTPQGTSYSVTANNISLTGISQGEIYWHISEDPNVGAGYMTPNGNGLEVCWWDGVGSPCQNSFEWFFFSEEAAQRYIDQRTEVDNALVGSWLIDEGPGARNVLTFIDNSRYVVFHEHTNADQTAGSGEYGNYTWDGLNFTSTVIDESDTQGGLGNSAFTAEVIGDQLFLDGETAIRIADPGNPIVGSWVIGSGDDLTVLTMLSSSEYALVHTLNTRCYGACTPQNLAGEFGSYTWDGYSFQVTGASVDTNGVDGFYDNENPANQQNELLEVNGATLTFTDAASESFVFNRVGAPTVNLVCGYESGWDDMLGQPLIFNSLDDYNTVVADCNLQNGPLPSFSKADLAGLTLYDGSGEVTFDGTANTAVFTDYGNDEIKDTGDDEIFYVVVSDYGTDQVILEYSSSLGGPIEGYDLLRLLSQSGSNYQFAVFYEEFAWAQSDGDDLDTTNKDGEIWYWDFTTEAPVLFACTTGDGNEGEFTNTFATYESAVSSCSVAARAITTSDLIGKAWNSDGETLVFNGDNTAVLNGFENFTWSLDGDYLVLWNEFNTYYDVYAIVDEAVNGSGNTVISVKVYNEDNTFGNLDRNSGADGDIWSSVVTITDQTLGCGYESGWDDINERPLVFNSVNDYYEVRASCESQNGTYAFSTSSLAGLTFYEEGGETRFVFDGAGTSGVATDAGVDGVLDTSDDETFYVTASHFDTNVVKLEGSLTQGGAAVLSELWSLEYYNANELGDGKDYWVFTVFSEDYSWPESDGSVNIDDNKGGEIWHNNVSTASDFNWAGL